MLGRVTASQIWEQEVAVYQQLTNMCEIFTEGSKPGVDYNSIEGEAPKLAAKIADLDKMLFESSPLVCDALLSDANDAPEHSRHLLLTQKERDEMVATINSSLPEIDEKNPDYLTSGAKALKIFLTKSGHRMANER